MVHGGVVREPAAWCVLREEIKAEAKCIRGRTFGCYSYTPAVEIRKKPKCADWCEGALAPWASKCRNWWTNACYSCPACSEFGNQTQTSQHAAESHVERLMWVRGGCRATFLCGGARTGICGRRHHYALVNCSCEPDPAVRDEVNRAWWRKYWSKSAKQSPSTAMTGATAITTQPSPPSLQEIPQAGDLIRMEQSYLRLRQRTFELLPNATRPELLHARWSLEALLRPRSRELPRPLHGEVHGRLRTTLGTTKHCTSLGCVVVRNDLPARGTAETWKRMDLPLPPPSPPSPPSASLPSPPPPPPSWHLEVGRLRQRLSELMPAQPHLDELRRLAKHMSVLAHRMGVAPQAGARTDSYGHVLEPGELERELVSLRRLVASPIPGQPLDSCLGPSCPNWACVSRGSKHLTLPANT